MSGCHRPRGMEHKFQETVANESTVIDRSIRRAGAVPGEV